jgi:hypothetical protein
MAIRPVLEAEPEQSRKKIDLSRELPKRTAILFIAAVIVAAFLLTTLVLWLLFSGNGNSDLPTGLAPAPESAVFMPETSMQDQREPSAVEAVRSGTDTGSDGQYLPISIDGSWGYIDTTGTLVIEATYEETAHFSEGIAAVRKNGRVGYIDFAGVWMVPPSFEEGLSFSEGMAAVSLNGKWGYINALGQLSIEPDFDNAQQFSEGLAAVAVEGFWGYLDQYGNWVVAARFNRAGPYSNGIAQVELNEQMGYIDRQGNWLWEPQHNQRQ